MESSYSYLINLGIILLAANLGGIVSKKFKQPAVLGQIIAGMILGMGLIEKTELINHLSEMGVIFLMFIAGLETDVDELKASGKSSSMIALGGVVFPIMFVSLATYFVTRDYKISIFMGIISTATSVSISVQTLREMGRLASRQGISILGAAIIDDIIGIILVTLAVGFFKPGEGSSIVIVVGKILLFFGVTFLVGLIITKLLNRYCETINLEDKIVTYAIVMCFTLAFISEELGVAAITGAYFSGVVFSMTKMRHKVSHEINRLATNIFTPIFFVSIGMGVDLGVALTAIKVGSVIIIFGALGKILGSGFGARLSGFDKHQALQIGFGMVPRAEVAIIIANLGVHLDLITEKELAAVILMVIVTTLLTPSLLKWSFEKENKPVRA